MSSLDQAMAGHQTNIWTNDGLLSIVQLGKHFNDKVNQTTKLFIKEVDSEIVVCEMADILSLLNQHGGHELVTKSCRYWSITIVTS